MNEKARIVRNTADKMKLWVGSDGGLGGRTGLTAPLGR